MEADDEVDRVALDVADEGFVAAWGRRHRLRDARKVEPLEEADGEVTVCEIDGVRVDGPGRLAAAGLCLGSSQFVMSAVCTSRTLRALYSSTLLRSLSITLCLLSSLISHILEAPTLLLAVDESRSVWTEI